MSKVKYYYDTEKLNYKRIEISPLKKIINILVFLSASSVLALALFVIFIRFLSTPNENKLKLQIHELKEENQLLTNWFEKDYNESKNLLEEIKQRDIAIYREYFGAASISNSIRNAGTGGSNKYDFLQKMSNNEILTKIKKQIDDISHQIRIESISLEEIYLLAEKRETMLASIPAIQPVANDDLKRMVSGFGPRIHPITKRKKQHDGMDFTASIGTPIYATGDGKVEISRYKRSGYGKYIIINHGYGYKTLYAHMSKLLVDEEEYVKRGDTIGLVGSTGLSAGPHLHYEVHKEIIDINNNSTWKPVNPAFYCYEKLNPKDYQKLIELADQSNKSFD